MAAKRFKLPTADEVEKLFSTVDETGHSNEEVARKQRKRRKEKGFSLAVDPLSTDDPSGSNVEKVIAKTAITIVLALVVVVVVAQVSFDVLRRFNTANLSKEVTYDTVYSALEHGVEWGGGFTQFPSDFKVIEANERTGRVEVSIIDTSHDNEMDIFASSQIQAAALSVNALLNPDINTVVYHVDVHVSQKNVPESSTLFGFLKPTGKVKRFMTFVCVKHATKTGVNFTYNITGISSEVMEKLKERVSSAFTTNLFAKPENTAHLLYKNRCSYEGDPAKIEAIASELNYPQQLQYDKVEVGNAQAPYALKISLTGAAKDKTYDFNSQATVLFALIDNIDQVSFVDSESGNELGSFKKADVEKALQDKSTKEHPLSFEEIMKSEEAFTEFYTQSE